MLLAIDIGNTTVGMVLMKEMRILKRQKISSALDAKRVRDNVSNATKKWEKELQRSRQKSAYGIEQVLICSVAPNVLQSVLKGVADAIKVKPMVIGRNIKVPLKNKYKNPKQVGQDRLVGAYAACELYGAPAIIIDLGTAITFDVISNNHEYLGGVIVPGLQLSAESLHNKTALLPKININKPGVLIGRNTQESMLSGLFYGYGSLCEGMIKRLSKEIGGSPKVIMTGGHTQLMQQFISAKIRTIDEDLVFKGLHLLSKIKS